MESGYVIEILLHYRYTLKKPLSEDIVPLTMTLGERLVAQTIEGVPMALGRSRARGL